MREPERPGLREADGDFLFRAPSNEEAKLSDRFVAAPIDLAVGSASFKARSDRKSLRFSQHVALRRLDA